MGNWIESLNIDQRGDNADFFNFIRTFYILECSYDVNGYLEYIGYAKPGSDTDEAAWIILKFTRDANNNITKRRVANGTYAFTQVYDDRATYTYS